MVMFRSTTIEELRRERTQMIDQTFKLPAAIYLCGPINGCADGECKDWRQAVTAAWPGRTVDPMRRDYGGVEDDNVEDLVELDKIDVINSDVVLVNYDLPSVGTSMEVLYAWERGKLVVVVARADERISPWLRYHSHRIFTSFTAALDFIGEVVLSDTDNPSGLAHRG